MKDYKEFTLGWLIFVFLVPVQLLFTYLYINNIGERPMSFGVYIAVSFLVVVVCFLFYGLTTKVNSEAITVSFGIGLIRKRIEIKRIKSIEQVKSPWYYGWGIRLIPNGMLYTMSGSDGVELSFNDTNRIVRIGTKDSKLLKDEILKRLNK